MGPARRPAYRIADEPAPGALGRFVVNPFWPMLASMLAGAWVGTPWFVFNTLALGSASRRREIAWALAGLLGAAALAAALFTATVLDLPAPTLRPLLRYGLVLITAWRLTAAYALYQLQDASFELHRHFGGAVLNGALLAIAAAFFPVRSHLGDDPVSIFLLLVLG